LRHRLMGQYAFARCRLSASSVPSVVCRRDRSGDRHYTAGQYCNVPLGRHLYFTCILLAFFAVTVCECHIEIKGYLLTNVDDIEAVFRTYVIETLCNVALSLITHTYGRVRTPSTNAKLTSFYKRGDF